MKNETLFTYITYRQYFNKPDSIKLMPIYPQLRGYTDVMGKVRGTQRTDTKLPTIRLVTLGQLFSTHK